MTRFAEVAPPTLMSGSIELVQYRVRRAEESLDRPVGADHLQVELALLACQWLGASVLRQPRASRS
jgi:hypothetical protein